MIQLPVVALLGASLVFSAAPTHISTDTDGDGKASTKIFCQETWPGIEKRAEKVITRAEADENTPGSIAWLNAEAQKAEIKGNHSKAGRLEDRAKRREKVLEHLQSRLGKLEPKVEKLCEGGGLK